MEKKTRFYYFKGIASEELMKAWQNRKLIEMMAAHGLPHRIFAYEDTALSFDMEVIKVGYKGDLCRQKLSGQVIARLDMDFAILENENIPYYQAEQEAAEGVKLKGWMESLPSGQELSERYAAQEKNKIITDEERANLVEDVKRKLEKLMTITEVSEYIRWTLYPPIVPFDEVWD